MSDEPLTREFRVETIDLIPGNSLCFGLCYRDGSQDLSWLMDYKATTFGSGPATPETLAKFVTDESKRKTHQLTVRLTGFFGPYPVHGVGRFVLEGELTCRTRT